MRDLICDIVDHFGGRIAGSEEERGAQLFFQSKLKNFCDSTTVHDFKAPLNTRSGSLWILVIGYAAAAVLYMYSGWLGFFGMTAVSVLFVGHYMTYGGWLNRLFCQKQSLNVVGHVKATTETPRQTVYLTAHMDSVYEFRWWYYFGTLGYVLTYVLGGAVFITAPFMLAAFGPIGSLIWGVGLIPLLTLRSSRKVDGAVDNLSGVAIVYSVAEYFAANRLRELDVKVVSFGAEEAGTQGSLAFANTYGQQMEEERAILINIDSIRSMDMITVLQGEPLRFARHDLELADRLVKQLATPELTPRCALPFFSVTDGASFSRLGLRTASLIGIDTTRHESFYHTRLDTTSLVDPEALESVKNGLVALIKGIDNVDD